MDYNEKEMYSRAMDFIVKHYDECPKFYQDLLANGFDYADEDNLNDLDDFIFASNNGMVFYSGDKSCGLAPCSGRCIDVSGCTADNFFELFDRFDKLMLPAHNVYRYIPQTAYLDKITSNVACVYFNIFLIYDELIFASVKEYSFSK